jgi:hypothetical protein
METGRRRDWETGRRIVLVLLLELVLDSMRSEG